MTFSTSFIGDKTIKNHWNSKKGRAICGLSMSGFQPLYISAQYHFLYKDNAGFRSKTFEITQVHMPDLRPGKI